VGVLGVLVVVLTAVVFSRPGAAPMSPDREKERSGEPTPPVPPKEIDNQDTSKEQPLSGKGPASGSQLQEQKGSQEQKTQAPKPHEDPRRDKGRPRAGIKPTVDTKEGDKEVWEQLLNLKPPELRRFPGHTDSVTSVAISKNGLRIVSGSEDGSVRVWETATGKPIGRPVKIKGKIYAVAIAPDGTHVAAASSDGGWLWDPDKADPARGLTDTDARSVLFDPKGEYVTFAGYRGQGTIESWTLSGQSFKRVGDSNPKWGIVSCLARGEKWLSFIPMDGDAHLWEIRDNKEVGTPVHRANLLESLAHSANDKYLVVAWKELAERVQLSDGKAGPRFKGHTDWIRAVAFSPNAMRVATASDDWTVRVWDAENARQLHRFGEQPWVRPTHLIGLAPTASPGGTLGQLVTLAVMKSDALPGHTGKVTCVAFSPDGTKVVSGSEDKTVRLWKVGK
jgi:WD40 repeat protein